MNAAIELFRARLLFPTVLLAGLALLAASWYATDPRASVPEHRRYVEGVVGLPQRINPVFSDGGQSAGGQTDGDLVALIFSGLTSTAGDGSPRPDLAERWEITPDGRAYTFFLRSDVQWHDGHRFDAGDVAFTIAHIQSADFAGDPDLARAWSDVTVTTPTDRIVIMRLPERSASFISRTAIGILPEHLLRGLDGPGLALAPFNVRPVGTGPFRLARLNRDRAQLQPNTSYYAGVPSLREFEMRFYETPAALIEALAAGQIDAALLGESSNPAERAVIVDRDDLIAAALPRNGYTVLYVNNDRPPFDDAALRRALLASVDRSRLALAARDSTGLVLSAIPGSGVIVPDSWAYAEQRWPAPPEAEALWAAAGWALVDGVRLRDGIALSLEIVTNVDPVRVAVAESIADDLRRVGIDATVTAVSAAEVLRNRLAPRDYDLAVFAWEAEIDPDPYGGWHSSQIADGGRNVAAYHDTTSDALLEAARLTLDIGERRALYRRFAARFVEQAPSLVLFYPKRLYVHPRDLDGLSDGLLFQPASRFRDVYLWRLGRSG